MTPLQAQSRVIPPEELLALYLQDRNNDPLKNPLNKQDENHTKNSYRLFGICHPDIVDIEQIDPEALKQFQIFLV